MSAIAEWIPDVTNWKSGLLTSRTGSVLRVLHNATLPLRDAEEWRGRLRYNEFTINVELIEPTPWGYTGPWTDQEDRRFAEWLQTQGIHVPVEIAGQAVQTVARQYPYHPVREYLNSLRWDGTERIDGWLSLYLDVQHSDYVEAISKRSLIQAVARIYKPGCKADCCLILEGEQGSRKSTALRTIAEPWFADELAELGSKDAAMQTRGVWVIEISELDAMSRAEVGKVKAFMSRCTDRFRPPYGHTVIEQPRQCVFAGSVNHSTYLRDETGGRRFWPVACGRILIDELARDRDQLWAEAVHRFRAGECWWLDSVALNRAAQQEQADRYEGGVWDGLIAEWAESRDSVSVEQILEFCIDKPKAHWTQTDRNTVARSLRALGWERFRLRTGNSLEWRYRRKT